MTQPKDLKKFLLAWNRPLQIAIGDLAGKHIGVALEKLPADGLAQVVLRPGCAYLLRVRDGWAADQYENLTNEILAANSIRN